MMNKQSVIFSLTKVFLLFVLVVLTNDAFAQKPKKEPKPTIYKNLNDALKDTALVTHLSLKGKGLDSIPSEVYLFENLVYLDLSKNKLTEIPKEIIAIPGLRYLSVSKNNIDTIYSWIDQMDLLEELIINQNPIKYLPASIQGCVSLQYIDAWGTEISTLPEEIANTPNLRLIDLQSINMSDKQQLALIESMQGKIKLELSHPCDCQ